MKKVSGLICAALSISLLAACSEEEKTAKPEVKQEEKQQPEETTETTTETAVEDLPETFAFFPSKKVEDDFKTLVGDDFRIFELTFEQVQAIPTGKDNERAFHGVVPGLEGAAEAIIIFNDEGKIWAATTEGENINVYHNGSEDDKHHPTLETWRDKFTEHTVIYK